jgi:pyrimidine operon attenuation protein/uracil phosphoribosyltransferase
MGKSPGSIIFNLPAFKAIFAAMRHKKRSFAPLAATLFLNFLSSPPCYLSVMPSTSLLGDANLVSTLLESLATAILQKHSSLEKIAMVGLPKRGYPIALRLSKLIQEKKGVEIPVGQMDITFHRDDLDQRAPVPQLTQIPFDATHKIILLVDDVLFTGRTSRAALSALSDFGRPDKIELLALIDRGHRQMPIQPDYTGQVIETDFQDRVSVHLREIDGEDSVQHQQS